MMLVIATCVGFTSCGDDDDDEDLPGSNSLVGVWEESGDGYSFSLTLNADGTGILAESEKGSSYTQEIEWEASENMIRIYADGGDNYWYYRIKGGSLYLYPTREDYDLDDPSYVCGKTGNGGTIDKPDSSINDLCDYAWRNEEFDPYPGEVAIYTTVYFYTDGTCTIVEEHKAQYEDNYKVTVNYSVEGNIRKGARLKMWGKTVDGDPYNQDYYAEITSDNVLILEADGERIEFMGTRISHK